MWIAMLDGARTMSLTCAESFFIALLGAFYNLLQALGPPEANAESVASDVECNIPNGAQASGQARRMIAGYPVGRTNMGTYSRQALRPKYEWDLANKMTRGSKRHSRDTPGGCYPGQRKLLQEPLAP